MAICHIGVAQPGVGLSRYALQLLDVAAPRLVASGLDRSKLLVA